MTLFNPIATKTGESDANCPPGLASETAIRFLDEARRREEEIAEPCRLDALPLTKLIGYLIDKHHVYARRQVAGIEALLAGISAAEANRSLPEFTLLRALFKLFRRELLFHMEKEEVSLFPRIIRAETDGRVDEERAASPSGSMRDSIKMLMREHDQLRAMLDSIRAATNEYTPPHDACASYQAMCQALRDLELDLLQLFHLEDNLLFRRALEMERHMLA